MRSFLMVVLLSGCTLNVVDKRLTREEMVGVVQTLEARDKILGEAVEKLTADLTELKKKGK
jgi:hypothetical protein